MFFVAQMTAVLVLAEVGEADEPAHEEPAPGEEPEPTETEPAETASDRSCGRDAAAGKEVFLGSAGCASCHTLADAGATGAIGPNLDATKPPAELVVERVTNGRAACRRSRTRSARSRSRTSRRTSPRSREPRRTHTVARLSPLGEVSERPKERDWKSRTC